MNDRELLELAAKAAGVEFGNKQSTPLSDALYLGPEGGWWNPLNNDGDALRLAVKSGLRVSIRGRATQVEPIPRGGCYEESWNDGDPYAATRRAIVRAAAEIGRGAK